METVISARNKTFVFDFYLFFIFFCFFLKYDERDLKK